jgi:Family of unknown function (DUF5994)
MAFTTAERKSASRSQPPASPRLQWGPTMSHRAPLHGAWWPRSDDPFQELPGLVVEIQRHRGIAVTCLMLGLTGWDSRPPRLRVAERRIRIGWFTTQPADLLTASCGDRYSLGLLIVPPNTEVDVAEAAMNLATEADNVVRASDILATVIARRAEQTTAATSITSAGS